MSNNAQTTEQVKPISRPGISQEMLDRAGVQHVDAEEAHRLCGVGELGILKHRPREPP